MWYLKVHQVSMNRDLKQCWLIFAFVTNVFNKLRKKSFYWKLGSFMGASWHVKGYELLEFLKKQSNLRKKRIWLSSRKLLGCHITFVLALHYLLLSWQEKIHYSCILYVLCAGKKLLANWKRSAGLCSFNSIMLLC